MKRETAANKLRVVFLMLIACFACIALSGFKADAATVTMGTDSFGLAYYSASSVSVKFNTGYSDVYGEVQILDVNMNVLASKDAYSYANISFASGDNQIYYYRVRPFIDGKNGKQYLGEFSPLKAYSTVKFIDKASKKKKYLKLKCPAIPGVTAVTVMMSTSRNDGYRPIANVKPGKSTKKIKKFGRKFAYYTYYYFYPQLTLANGVPCENVTYQSVYFYKKLRRR